MRQPLPKAAAWAAEYTGLPYKVGGRDRSGVDCYGLVLMVWRERFGIVLPEHEGIGWSPAASETVAGLMRQESERRWQTVVEPVPGDAIMLRVYGHPCHVGIVPWPGFMLHCLLGSDSVCERYDGIEWRDRVTGFYRHIHAAD